MADQTPEKPTGDPRWDAVLARLEAKAAEEEARKATEVENESQSGPESARSDSPRGKGRVEAADAAEDASGSSKVVGDAVVGNEGKAEEEGVRAVTRLDPILPSVQVVTVQEHPAREAGRLAFGGLVEGQRRPGRDAAAAVRQRAKDGSAGGNARARRRTRRPGNGPRSWRAPRPPAVRGRLCHDAAGGERDTGCRW